jgi:hypothetical protein
VRRPIPKKKKKKKIQKKKFKKKKKIKPCPKRPKNGTKTPQNLPFHLSLLVSLDRIPLLIQPLCQVVAVLDDKDKHVEHHGYEKEAEGVDEKVGHADGVAVKVEMGGFRGFWRRFCGVLDDFDIGMAEK